MSELVASNAKEHLYLVLHQYHDGLATGDTESRLARAHLEKDQPFFVNSSSSNISAVSLRISLFGQVDGRGYKYKNVMPSWFIAADKPSVEAEGAAEKEQFVASRLHSHVYNFKEQDKKITLRISKNTGDEDAITKTVALHDLMDSAAGEFNKYKITRNAEVKMAIEENKHYLLKFTDNPVNHLVGPGFGNKGLGSLRGIIKAVSDVQDIPDNDDPNAVDLTMNFVSLQGDEGIGNPDATRSFQIIYSAKKSELPNKFTLIDFAKYLSSGVHLHYKDLPGGCVFSVLGPSAVQEPSSIQTREDPDEKDQPELQIEDVVHTHKATANGFIRVPRLRMRANDGHYFGDAQSFVRLDSYNAHSNEYVNVGTATVPRTISDWFWEDAETYNARLAVEVTGNALTGRTNPLNFFGGDQTPNFPEAIIHESNRNRLYYAYDTQLPPALRFEAKDVPCDVKYFVDGTYQADYAFDGAQDIAVENLSDLGYGKVLTYRVVTVKHERIEARTWSSQPVPIQTCNEMFSIFNAPLINPDKLWTLGTAVNGGFQIQMSKTNPMGRFEISEDFALEMGLKPIMKSGTTDKSTETPDTKDVYILAEVHPGDEKMSKMNENFDNFCYEGELSDFYIIADGLKTPIPPGQDLWQTENTILYHKETNKPYKSIDKVRKTFHVQRDYITTTEADIIMGPYGNAIWRWEKPPLGGIIQNTGMVSPETFSLYSGIIVTIPSLPFQSQQTSYSGNGERALLELRFPVTASFSTNLQGEVTGTSMPVIGDLLWNRTGNHQWLPLSGAGSIYQLEARAALVYRDAASRPPEPIFLAPGGVFQLKICLLRTA